MTRLRESLRNSIIIIGNEAPEAPHLNLEQTAVDGYGGGGRREHPHGEPSGFVQKRCEVTARLSQSFPARCVSTHNLGDNVRLSRHMKVLQMKGIVSELF